MSMSIIQETLQRVQEADVSGIAICTPLHHARKLSRTTNNHVYMKREDMQSVHSFKCRGAYNKIRQLPPSQQQLGIIAASAGNHAQGVAMSAKLLQLPATIVMPETTPSIKVTAVQASGATVLLHGDSYDEAYDRAKVLAEETGQTLIHPYDDDDVIAGQGTIAIEILSQLKTPIDYIFVAVGGGGLLAGILAVFKARSPHTSVIAVEPSDSDCLNQAILANQPVRLPSVGIFADGVAVKQIGQRPFDVIQSNIDDCITVSTDDICAAIKDIYDETRCVMEPAGALSLAGMKQYIQTHALSNATIITINCGANMNFDRLRYVAERAEIGEQKEALFMVTIPEKPGSLKAFCSVIGKRTITEFNYRYQSTTTATLFLGVSIQSSTDITTLLTTLNNHHYPTIDMTQNELAKLHIRHMIGGRPTPPIRNERIFRCQFPERPGALMHFLNALLSDWSISLFHYRNHGAAYGRVLVGLDIPEHDQSKIDDRMAAIGFNAIDETTNPAYQQLL